MHITRRYRLTFAGVKRVIAREHHGARVMSVKYAAYAKR
jgi:Mor family transcriptional regulator